jgi:hypothetical protein
VLVRAATAALRHQQWSRPRIDAVRLSVAKSLGRDHHLCERTRSKLCRRYRCRSNESGPWVWSELGARRIFVCLAIVGADVHGPRGARIHIGTRGMVNVRRGRRCLDDRLLPNPFREHRVRTYPQVDPMRPPQRSRSGAGPTVPSRLGRRVARLERNGRTELCRRRRADREHPGVAIRK